ncbi:fungal cellulose binding domain-containing protein [Mycena alexandri]|uniref:Fungal cellulose binding domain-containing protein n=1 Tax=Mycena alexandri TaxID=1745969 RepID=A0AAD6WUF9_9AGAR|nr:fungal cellulose binding domain-containing protein [Mycena alexandri]
MFSLRSLVALAFIVSTVRAGVAQPEPKDPKGKPPPHKPTTYWFAFGDSYTTTSFDPTSTLPALGLNPLGNPAFPGVTGGGGENYVGFDTVTYNKSLILTYDYAAGGATINGTLVAPITIALSDEVDEFLVGAAKKPKTSPWTSGNALFSVWIGINDIGNTFYLNGSRDAFSDVLLDDYFAQVQRLVRRFQHSPNRTNLPCTSTSYSRGRNYLFINVPPTYRAPLLVSFFSPDQLLIEKSVINTFNAKLVAKVQEFKKKNHGVTTWVYDSYSIFAAILDDPTKYGFSSNITGYGDPGQFWGNSYHPSSPVQHILAKQIGEQLTGTPWF